MLIQVEEKKNASFFRCFYSNSWLKEPFTLGHPILDKNVPKPQTLQLMLDFQIILVKTSHLLELIFMNLIPSFIWMALNFFPGLAMNDLVQSNTTT